MFGKLSPLSEALICFSSPSWSKSSMSVADASGGFQPGPPFVSSAFRRAMLQRITSLPSSRTSRAFLSLRCWSSDGRSFRGCECLEDATLLARDRKGPDLSEFVDSARSMSSFGDESSERGDMIGGGIGRYGCRGPRAGDDDREEEREESRSPARADTCSDAETSCFAILLGTNLDSTGCFTVCCRGVEAGVVLSAALLDAGVPTSAVAGRFGVVVGDFGVLALFRGVDHTSSNKLFSMVFHCDVSSSVCTFALGVVWALTERGLSCNFLCMLLL
mmetsp:Transcript_66690/g.159442  ORF Transcript_66690/g.159442 Transcript_66690/m.159442 type:complete len:275 (-) Transcript_66690:624-1448(-)